MKDNTNRIKNKITLTSKEKSELLIEGIVTIILLILLNLAVYMLVIQFAETNQPIEAMLFNIKESIYNTFYIDHPYSLKLLIISFMGLIDVFVLFWRLIRRYKQMQQAHIISELHYISSGHYNHRIPFQLNGDLGRLINSINALVDSTVKAIEDERLIEQSKDELITNVSHDIRTPLTSIIGYLGLIEDGQYQSTDDLLKYTHTAYLKSKQMKLLVDDLFEYTKVRQADTPLNTMTFNMSQLLEQLVIEYELESTKNQIPIELTIESPNLIMEGDTEKLVRVFDNLLSNAFKYGLDGSKIVIMAKKVDQMLIIEVKNNGQEIPQEALEHLFDRFYRVEESRSLQTGGSGLGLAIAQSIVELHHGEIYATSANGWTSFIIKLPLKNW
ncbi:two-component sensor histidine kinase [Vagococcus penaei]|uniref:histidine kinase n=1 Tax=Vagococcus penaei TaxID=633807 RepID=A0A1Q2D624_9ENTE|nr:HAMP domain-containing sensor histidine kinase [Vagococcus penaei]AQP53870.1 two-component sensor histidine kinase [Vagococcus penaei]RSU02967.1 two-component sensor histidine kinase [Vagococcus penaei]